MENFDVLKQQIVDQLRPFDPKFIILFGSYAHGTQTKESDIDLYVVTKDNFIPQNYNEKRQIVRKISRALMDIRLKVNLDLMVHTQPMHQKFYKMNSVFAQEIQEKGVHLL